MSQIAQALAKAKERTGLTTAPFAVSGQAVKPVAPAKIKNSQRTWVLLLSFVMVFGGLSLWYSGRFNLNSPVADTAPTPGNPVVTKVSSTGSTGTTTPRATTVTNPIARSEVQDTINALVISAVMPGQQPRIMLQGRVVGVGQPVDASIVFSGIKSDRLMFTDSDGAVYLRRY